MSEMPKSGEKAPDFSLPNQKGNVVKLSELKGKKVCLYFYPKDDTPGCTKQACNIRDNWKALEKKGILVFGISKDSVKSHGKFAEKYSFSFPVLSDEKKEVIEKYGVFKEKSMYGKTFLGVQRTTFLINEKGIIIKIIKKPVVGNHAEEIVAGFEA
ncbi:MAG: thioredoxin-dependent thiol peroxidase [Candidatus Diapherotrites archaeon CG11_big_fil_rev_8_21_14_0_20_37_9]|nr:MAG: thioredoxin-dependent thiol peroxidase [Candidatus Diapherotrites archaeon CG11_big_fil_rev_8_21_14_0_20_37_9]